jgi:hypothetical protein
LAAAGRYGDALQAADAANPVREAVHRIVIRLHLGEGNVCEASQACDHFRVLLADELGVRPSEPMTQLGAGLHAAAPHVGAGAAAAVGEGEMSATILFVHGTGVRADGYIATLRTIERQLVGRGRPAVEVRGCFWGEAAGAKLLAGGASIPGYGESGGTTPSETDQVLALWSVLYTDPWYELRLLRNRPSSGPAGFGQEPPAAVLRRTVHAFVPSDDVADAFREVGLGAYLHDALAALRAAPELADAVATAPPEPLEHRRAIARAVVAWTLIRAQDAGEPALDGATRDHLVLTLTSALRGEGLGVGEWLLRPVKGLALRMVTSKLTGDRGSLSDAAAPTAGDILRFLAHGDDAREYVRAQIEAIHRGAAGDADTSDNAPAADEPDSIYLLAHSLGGIICADLLVRGKVPGVAGLITVGSQAPFMYEIGAFPGLSHPSPLPDHMPRWLNVYDRRDILSYIADPVFPGRASDVQLDNGQPFPQSHSAYWTNPALWAAIDEFMT